MVEAGQHAGLGFVEQGAVRRGDPVGVPDLDGHLAPELFVIASVDHAKAARAQSRLDQVAAQAHGNKDVSGAAGRGGLWDAEAGVIFRHGFLAQAAAVFDVQLDQLPAKGCLLRRGNAGKIVLNPRPCAGAPRSLPGSLETVANLVHMPRRHERGRRTDLEVQKFAHNRLVSQRRGEGTCGGKFSSCRCLMPASWQLAAQIGSARLTSCQGDLRDA